MATSLWIGTTGLAGSEKQLDVIANNLANANTPGYKASDTNFNSMLSQNLSGGSQQRVGQGVGVASISTIFDQGSFETTGNSTDVAIDGNGFFIVKDNEGRTMYTRAGGFEVNKAGFLADQSDYTVQGHRYNETGDVEDTALTDLDLRNIQSKPKATTIFSLGLTLDSETEKDGTFDVSQVLFDSRGAEHTLNTVFTKFADNESKWKMEFFLDETLATSQTIKGIEFDGEGALSKIYEDSDCTTEITPLEDGVVRFYAVGDSLVDGATLGDAASGEITWDLTSLNAEEIRSFATTSRISSLTIDGYAPGTVTSLDVNANGVIEGMFSNGQRQNVARLMLADFSNLQGLSKTGGYFIETNESGTVIINKPGTGGLGEIQSHSIEMSNTDTGKEFIKMIMAQRAYQSSAKVITTGDQMTQILMNVKQ